MIRKTTINGNHVFLIDPSPKAFALIMTIIGIVLMSLIPGKAKADPFDDVITEIRASVAEPVTAYAPTVRTIECDGGEAIVRAIEGGNSNAAAVCLKAAVERSLPIVVAGAD